MMGQKAGWGKYNVMYWRGVGGKMHSEVGFGELLWKQQRCF